MMIPAAFNVDLLGDRLVDDCGVDLFGDPIPPELDVEAFERLVAERCALELEVELEDAEAAANQVLATRDPLVRRTRAYALALVERERLNLGRPKW